MNIKKILVVIFSSFALISSVMAVPVLSHESEGYDKKQKMRYFMGVARPNAKAWKWLIDNPQDRQVSAAKAVEKLGGEMLGYYWGLGDGRNYVIVALPDADTAKAIQVLRLSSDLLYEYDLIELITSADMMNVFKKIGEIRAVDDLQKE